MRDIKRRPLQSSRPSLRRGADGRLRTDGDGMDIGDLWAEQKRIRLAEAIEEDKRRAAKKQLPWWRRVDAIDSFLKNRDSIRERAAGKPSSSPDPARKEISIVLSVPAAPRLSKAWPYIKSQVPRGLELVQRIPRKRMVLGLVSFVMIGAIGTAILIQPEPKPKAKADIKGSQTGLTGSGPSIQKGNPSYHTVLPEGKNINDLGGWARVSPPGKDPVYAYTDSLVGVALTVSQQPLPANFKSDPSALTKLAEQFSAKDKIPVEGVTAFVGISAKGPQSVIAAKDNVLILIKSESYVPNEAWAAYLKSLK